MSKWIKQIRNFGLIGFFMGVLITFIGILLGGSLMWINIGFPIERESTCYSDTAHMDKISEAEITISTSKFIIVQDEFLQIRTQDVVKGSLTFSFENEVLKIQEYPYAYLLNSMAYLWNLQPVESYIVITIPSSITTLTVTTGEGEAFLDSLTLSDLTVHGRTNSIALTKMSVESLTIYGNQGDITFEGVILSSASLIQGQGLTLLQLNQTSSLYIMDDRLQGSTFFNDVLIEEYGTETDSIHVSVSGEAGNAIVTAPN